jgi:hypothetical protein
VASNVALVTRFAHNPADWVSSDVTLYGSTRYRDEGDSTEVLDLIVRGADVSGDVPRHVVGRERLKRRAELESVVAHLADVDVLTAREA